MRGLKDDDRTSASSRPKRRKAVRDAIGRVLADIKRNTEVAARLTESSDLVAEVGLDSLELTELVLRLEDELAIEMDLSQFDWDSLRSLDRFVDFVLQSKPL